MLVTLLKFQFDISDKLIKFGHPLNKFFISFTYFVFMFDILYKLTKNSQFSNIEFKNTIISNIFNFILIIFLSSTFLIVSSNLSSLLFITIFIFLLFLITNSFP